MFLSHSHIVIPASYASCTDASGIHNVVYVLINELARLWLHVPEFPLAAKYNFVRR